MHIEFSEMKNRDRDKVEERCARFWDERPSKRGLKIQNWSQALQHHSQHFQSSQLERHGLFLSSLEWSTTLCEGVSLGLPHKSGWNKEQGWQVNLCSTSRNAGVVSDHCGSDLHPWLWILTKEQYCRYEQLKRTFFEGWLDSSLEMNIWWEHAIEPLLPHVKGARWDGSGMW